MAFPAGGFVDGVIGAEELSAAGEHGVAVGGVVGASLLGVAVGAGANEVAFADEVGDFCGRAVVALQEGCVGLTGVGVGEDDAVTQGRMAFEVDGRHGVLVHEEDDLATGFGEGRPVAGEDGLIERFVVAADVVGSDDFAGLEDGTDLGVEGVEGRGGKWFGFGEMELVAVAGFVLLGFDEDEDGDVVGVGFRPLLDLLQAAGEGLAGAAVVDVLDVHDFEAGLEHEAVGIKFRIGGETGGGYVFRAGGMGVAATLGVGVDVEFNLADSAVELRWEWLVLVVEPLVGFGILCLPELAFVGRDTGVVAVVGADDLDLVELDGTVV